jgi:methylmalonyl-CoA mutase N-terminal domain/subunit
MIEFVQKQLEASERLFQMMVDDHKERMVGLQVWVEMNESYQKKLAERDAEIAELKALIAAHKAAEKL